jgi:uncharacterized protein (TIGR01777 family)
MRTVIAGGSGFLGQALSASLAGAGHHIQILTRHARGPGASPASAAAEHIAWTADGSVGPWAGPCAGADLVINLAGESIGSRRWSAAQKARLIQSRLLATRSLARFVKESSRPPAAFISASAIGFYGNRGGETLTEDAAAGTDFLAGLAASWEREALAAQGGATRLVLLRTGIVLDPGHGALASMLTPFRFFAGGPFGSGRQFMSWIHRDDWVSLVRWAIDTPACRGALNLTAPNPVTNAAFARALGRALHRPAFLPAPAFALSLLLGEMAGPLLLFSQRVVPARAEAGGFRFAFPELDGALADLLNAPVAPAA